MRLALLAAVSLLPLMLMGCAGQNRSPYCSRAIPGEGDAIRCSFPTMEACNLEIGGRGGFCMRNPALADERRTR
jgi:hypothetical protein